MSTPIQVKPLFTPTQTDAECSRIKRAENGQCIIGMQKLAMIPLIAFDLLANVSHI